MLTVPWWTFLGLLLLLFLPYKNLSITPPDIHIYIRTGVLVSVSDFFQFQILSPPRMCLEFLDSIVSDGGHSLLWWNKQFFPGFVFKRNFFNVLTCLALWWMHESQPDAEQVQLSWAFTRIFHIYSNERSHLDMCHVHECCCCPCHHSNPCCYLTVCSWAVFFVCDYASFLFWLFSEF